MSKLEAILNKFGEQYDMPYKLMHSMDKTPMEQMPLAREQLVSETVIAILAAFTSLHSMEMEHVLAGIHAKDESGELLKIVRNALRQQIINEVNHGK